MNFWEKAKDKIAHSEEYCNNCFGEVVKRRNRPLTPKEDAELIYKYRCITLICLIISIPILLNYIYQGGKWTLPIYFLSFVGSIMVIFYPRKPITNEDFEKATKDLECIIQSGTLDIFFL